jgi:N-formylglutamate amidohydrolase
MPSTGTGSELFFLESHPTSEWPLLVTVPHAGVFVPPAIETAMLRTGETPPKLLRRLMDGCDPYTDRIYDWPEIRFRAGTRVSRFVVDLNRSRADLQENGVIKRTDFNRVAFYPDVHTLSANEQEYRLTQYWDPVYRAIEQALAKGGYKLLLDGHSMSAQGPSLGPDRGGIRPAVSVVDARGRRFTCSQSVIEAAAAAAEKGIREAFPDWPAASRVAVDQPFDGGHIAYHFSHPQWDWALPTLLVECNRDLYLNEATLLPKSAGLAHCRSITRQIAEAALSVLSDS